MLGIYLIALVGPLVVFGPLAFAMNRIARSNRRLFESKQRAIALYVGLPIAVSYGLEHLARFRDGEPVRLPAVAT